MNPDDYKPTISQDTFTLETHCEVWDDKTGNHIKIGPDRDGLDLVEIRRIDNQGKEEASMTILRMEAKLLAKAINQLLGKK